MDMQLAGIAVSTHAITAHFAPVLTAGCFDLNGFEQRERAVNRVPLYACARGAFSWRVIAAHAKYTGNPANNTPNQISDCLGACVIARTVIAAAAAMKSNGTSG